MAELDDATLAELAQLAREATPGPWTVTGCTRGADWVCSGRGCLTNTEDGTFRPANAEYIAAANPATVAGLVAEVRQLRQCLAGVRHSVQMNLAGLQDEPAFAVPLVVRGLGQTIDAIDAALDGGQ